MDQIKNKDFYEEVCARPEENIRYCFSDFLKVEEEYLINTIEIEKGIAKNNLLKEIIFPLFLSLNTNIPFIIIGKPGTGKSLCANLICQSMKGKNSKNKFFQLFPEVIQTNFQDHESTHPEDIDILFDKAEKQILFFKKKNLELPISMILYDDLGSAKRSESNPLKLLQSKLEHGCKKGVSFVGISNSPLDSSIINKALFLSVSDLDRKLDDLIETSYNIVGSISEKLKNNIIFRILCNTYFRYKDILQIIKELIVYKQFCLTETTKSKAQVVSNKKEKRQFESIKNLKKFKDLLKKEDKIKIDFHGNRDFYYLIKKIALTLERYGDSNDNEKVSIISEYIERNFGGINYEIDIDFNLCLDDIRNDIDLIKTIFEDYEDYEPNKRTILSSVFLFKQLYNLEIKKEDPNSDLIIDRFKINEYNLNNCINNNIRDSYIRYLLLGIEPSLTALIYNIITLQNPLKQIILIEGSPFTKDNNKEYRLKIINMIQNYAKDDILIIIENLKQIHPFLLDLYNMNYIVKDNNNYARIWLENFNAQLTLINYRFRMIILVDKEYVNECDFGF